MILKRGSRRAERFAKSESVSTGKSAIGGAMAPTGMATARALPRKGFLAASFTPSEEMSL